MDIKMPVMNGFDATREIKKVNRNIPVIAVTAYALADDRNKCIAAGCDEFVSKPVSRKDLISLARSWINS
jgi:CheY-like chemotaxis protein